MYNVYSKFDIEKHKKTYFYYLEVIVFPDGHVEYSVPSHQEKLISVCCSKLNISRDDLIKMCPREYYCDFLTWLCNQSECIALWYNSFWIGNNQKATRAQMETIEKLKAEKVYEGDIPEC